MSVEPQGAIATPQAAQIGRLARQGAVWAFVIVAGRQITAFVTSVVLARLLGPREFGIIAMAATLTAFLTFVSDAGLSMVTIQKRELNRRQVDNLFWVNTAVGFLLWAISAAAGPALARFYKCPELVRIMPILGLSFLAGGFGVQPLALMRRNIQQKSLAVQEAVAAAIYVGVGIGLALAGFSYWALVWQAVAYSAARTVLGFAASRYVPGGWSRAVGTRGLLRFGGALCIYAVFVYLTRNLDNILIGHAWGKEALGFYSRAYFLMMAPSLLVASALGDVMVPSLAALHHDSPRMGAAYRRSVLLVGFVACPISMWLAVAAPEVIRFVYGSDWMPAAPILMWLSLAGVLQPVYSTIGWLFLASAATRPMMAWYSASTAIIAGAFALGLSRGPIGVAMAYAIVMALGLMGPGMVVAHRAAGISTRATVRPLVPILASTILMGAMALLAGFALHRAGASWLLTLVAKTLLALLVYVGAALAWMRPLPVEPLEALLKRVAPGPSQAA